MGALSLRHPAEKRICRAELSSIAPSPYQPRRHFDDTELQSLAESIRRHGLLCPLLVRRSESGFELIAGERRLRALQLLGHTHADVIITAAFDRECALIGLVENLQREDVHFLDQAQACRRILREHNLTQEELAASLGRSPSALANLLRLLRLGNDVRACIRSGGLSERHARALLRLEKDEDRLSLAAQAAREQLSVRQLEELIRQREAPRNARKASPPRFQDCRLVINALRDTVKQLRRIGIDAACRVENREDSYDVIVTIRTQAQ